MISSLFFILLSITNADNCWASHMILRICYCSMCPGQISCQIIKGGCYEEIINNTYHFYGCWAKREYNAKCSLPQPVSDQDEDRYILWRRYNCCNGSDWCNLGPNEDISSTTDALITSSSESTESVNASLSCYCNTCGLKYSCKSNSLCYRDVWGIRAKYGCMRDGSCQWACYHTYNQHLAGDAVLNSSKLCHHGEQWCNFDSRLLQTLSHWDTYNQTLKYNRILWVTFKEKKRYSASASFIIKAFNSIGTRIKMTISRLVASEMVIEVILENDDFIVDVTDNVFYKLFVPVIGYLTIGPTKDVYFAKVINTRSPWLPEYLEIDLSIPTVVICRS